MATEFLMPKLGLTMEEGTITEWLVEDGVTVGQGTAVLRIETDKTETDVEASAAGRLHTIAAVGDTFACGEQIGWFLADGEEAPSTPALAGPTTTPTPTTAPPSAGPSARTDTAAAAASASTGRLLASPNARRVAAERGLDLRAVRGTGPGGRIVSEDLEGIGSASSAVPPAPSRSGDRPALARSAHGAAGVPATAAARQLADLLGVDLSTIDPDPLDRRVTREAVALHVRTLLAASASTVQAAPAVLPAALQTPTEVIPLSGMRGTIAKRMHGSLMAMAQLTLTMEADLDAVVADREARKSEGPPPTYTDYIIAAVARALGDHPIVNSQITDDGVALLPNAHVGMAVALDGGLIVPVIRDTASRDLADLTAESKRLAGAARAGSLQLAELEGGTISVSTLGMFGVDMFTPVINPPNTAILGVGRLRDDVVLDADGNVGTTKRLTLSLTWDHRAFDGAPAAAFCQAVAALLNDPPALDKRTAGTA
ncbi:MAG: dihydrolipoamide acetyltransferase family protein [Acidimicrobiia bacterium]|nr:dihydrolipoamide acetyltransferase family protein [Acidimicrobiia bacterium]